ncbi:MAG: septal ring lytic transglycosylase RlpA family protein, partial [Saprospiraceae bacterium]|nr:septal ring lytic transglycosylase RlpA family protein [Saprospiraceae bacterium]
MRKSRIFLTFFLFLATIFQSLNAQEYGKASVYSTRFQGGATASGEKFNHSDFTVAHRTHKFNTRLRITRMDNGRSVIVRVNDRGPFVSDCVTDMSKATATKLGISDDATIVQIKIEVVTDINIPLGSVTVVDKKKDNPTA